MFVILWNGEKKYFRNRFTALEWIIQQFKAVVGENLVLNWRYYLTSPPSPPDLVEVVLSSGQPSEVSALFYPG